MEKINQHFIFDIGGVLISYDQHKLIDYLSRKHKTPIIDIEKLFTPDLLRKVETGKLSSNVFFSDYISQVLNISYDEWISSLMDNYEINEPGIRLLNMYKNNGHPVYILSNQAEYNAVAIRKKFPYFYKMCTKNFLSFEMGMFKPDIEIYQAVCLGIGSSPDTCTFYDDMPDNVSGAIVAGMKGVLFSNNVAEKLLML